MAATEARAAWQRTANRCWVQEDAKRAPKLACCPSTSTAQQYDLSNGNATSEHEHPTHNYVPLNWNPMNSNLPPDTRWWLQMQLNFGCPKDFTSELNVFEVELEERVVESVMPSSTISNKRLDRNNGDYPSESPGIVSTACMKNYSETRVDEMTVTNISQKPLKRKVDSEDYLFQDWEFIDWKPADWLISKKTERVDVDLDSPWAGHKGEPWWRKSDQDELASLVAQKSLEQIENCDLPKPSQIMHVSRDPFVCLKSLDGNKIFSSSVSYMLHSSMSYWCDYPQHSSTSGSINEKCRSSSDGSHFPSDTEKLYSGNQSYVPPANDLPENSQNSESNSSRAELLEALRHSQTRAREAEIAAQSAYNEKEHIVKLFFKQASHLFAYKQWLRMLQLESLCLQLPIKEHQISTLFPVLPFMPHKGDGTKSKVKKHKKCSFCKYTVAFAVGLGLAGAGFLLGWTLGWLLPHLKSGMHRLT